MTLHQPICKSTIFATSHCIKRVKEAILYAAICGHYDCAMSIKVERGITVSNIWETGGHMVVAAAIGNYAGLSASALLKLGVSPNSSYSSPSSSVCNLYKSAEFVRRVSLVESTIRFDNLGVPLLAAASFYLLECAKLLLNWGANPNILSKKGNSPIPMLPKQGHAERVRLLLRHGAIPDLCHGPSQTTALEYAAKIITRNVSKYFFNTTPGWMLSSDLVRNTNLK